MKDAEPQSASLPFELPSLRRREAPPQPRAFVLTHPDGAFASVVKMPRPALMVLVVCAFALLPPIAFVISANQHGGLESVLKDEMRKSGALERMQNLPEAQRDEAMARIVPTMKFALPAGALGKRLVWLLWLSTIAFLALRGTSKTPLTWRATVAITAVGMAPWLVHDALTAAVFLTSDLRALDPQNAVASNLTALLWRGADSRTWWAIALRGVDVFELWGCWLTTTGVVRLTGTRTMTPYLLTFGSHALTVVLAAAKP